MRDEPEEMRVVSQKIEAKDSVNYIGRIVGVQEAM